MKYLKLQIISVFLLTCVVSCSGDNSKKDRVDDNGFVTIETLSEFKTYITKDNVKVKLKEGNYQIDDAESIRFIQLTGSNSHFDLTGVRFMVDTKLFSRTDLAKSDDGNGMYCAIEISGKNIIKTDIISACR